MTAAALARYLVCSAEGERPCGVCRQCREALEGNHPDIVTLVPRGKSRQIAIEQIRSLLQAARLNARQGDWKVFIVDEAETMGMEAANALLKTLEEPQPGTVLILVTSRPDLLPPTIVSRCQPVNFKPWSRDRLAELVSTLLPGEDPEHLSRLAAGSPGRVVAMAESGFLPVRTRVLEVVEANWRSKGAQAEAAAREVLDLLAVAEKAAARGLDNRRRQDLEPYQMKEEEKKDQAAAAAARAEFLRMVLEIVLRWYWDLYLFQNLGEEGILTNRDRLEPLRAMARMEPGSLIRAAALLEEAGEGLFRRNTSPELVLAGLFSRLGALVSPAGGQES